MEKKDEQKE